MATDQRLKPGDIVLVEIPLSDGHEQHGLRPAVLVTSVVLDLATAIPLTANQEALGFPHTLEIKPTKANGLAFSSVALLYQIRALDEKRCQRRLGKLNRDVFIKVLRGLKTYLGL